MKPQSAKAKGRRLQQKVVRTILDAFPGLEDDDCRSTSMGCGGEDVLLSPAARRLVPLSIECKCQERLNIWSAVEQAECNAPNEAKPCVVFSKNHAKLYAVLPWDYVLELLSLPTREPAPAAAAAAEAPQIPDALRELIEQLHQYSVSSYGACSPTTGTPSMTTGQVG
tara:strand:+ start:59 stop:562 length:504 start_codon:yes stop_codon:yes gene_type:complete